MAKMPERIWAWGQPHLTRWSTHADGKDTTEYVRADLLDEAVKALEPFAFLDPDNPDEDTQTAWELRYRDRFKDWIDFGDIEQARATLAKLRSKT